MKWLVVVLVIGGDDMLAYRHAEAFDDRETCRRHIHAARVEFVRQVREGVIVLPRGVDRHKLPPLTAQCGKFEVEP